MRGAGGVPVIRARVPNDHLNEGVAEAELREKLHNDVARFVYERTKRRPMVLPVVVEV